MTAHDRREEEVVRTKKPERPIALQLLRQEQELIGRLLDRLLVPEGDLEHERQVLIEELERHMRLEEQVFYPALGRMEVLTSFVQSLHDQHARIRLAVLQLAQAAVTDKTAFVRAAEQVNELVTMHVLEEQNRAFTYAEEYLTSELDAIAVELEDCREALRGAFGVG
ncbi:MAG: hemerythrin domain-containing protein [Burkholderiales bacterium]|nr:hemerythrin domain-containing protein [Burkholderiales bacterium]